MRKRKPSEITHNGKTLQKILDAHYKYLTTSTMEGRAVLRSADLSGADLSGAVLSGADLSGADLSGADLSFSDLSGADLRSADLRFSDLRSADLNGADLRSAKNIPNYVRAVTSILPDGDIIGWKKCNDNIIVKMEIPAKAKRSNATGRKCRAEFVKVLALFDGDGKEMSDDAIAISQRGSIEYRKGKIVKPDGFDENRWEECSNGIHFFITRLEAEFH